MATFPRIESEIMPLAQSLSAGLAAGAADFPAPPVPVAELEALRTAFQRLCDEQVAARAAAEQVTARKAAALKELVAAMKADLRYAEDAVQYDDARLTALGWGAYRPATPRQPPGQPYALAASQQGAGWVLLTWKKAADGGPVAAYRLERRPAAQGQWTLAAMALEPEMRLEDQERGREWEYRIIATSRAGASDPSNTVAVVL